MSALELLQDLLRCDTSNPPGNEGPAVEVLRSFLDRAGLETRVEKSPAGRPTLIARIAGPRDRPALVLLSHTDVVAVEHERWSHDPFGGEVADGMVWGRGALDMKSIAAMHAGAAAALAESAETPAREVIVCAVADEEAGGREGAEWLLREHPDLVGFDDDRPSPEAIGEGGFGLAGIIDRPVMPIVTGEKSALWLQVTVRGEPGHGSIPPRNQAIVNLTKAVRQISGYGRPRVHPVMREQLRILASETSGARRTVFRALASGAGPVVANALKTPLRSNGAIGALLSDTATPTSIAGGYKHNVVPGDAKASLDCRLLPDTEIDEYTQRAQGKVSRYGASVEVLGAHRGPVSDPSPLYGLLKQISQGLESRPVVVPSLSPGFTDLRHFRARGAPGFGWVPLVLTPELLGTIHGHDERVPLDEFQKGVAATTDLVRAAAAKPR